MKQLIYALTTLLLITLTAPVFSQDWIPIAENDTYHYEIIGATMAYDSIISYGGLVLKNTNPADATISIDFTTTGAGQMMYELNKVVTPCETCPWGYQYRNQPQFLQHRMIHFEADEKIVFQGDANWEIYPKAPLGTTWIFDAFPNISAEVTAVEAGNVLGNPDSLKTISLSTGEDIVLSKAHGIVRFPKFDDGTYYELIGIQTRDLGFTIPGAKEIYNFEVGDVFQYFDYAESFFPFYERTTQIHILDKEEFADSIRYDTKTHTYRIQYDYYYFPDLIADTIFTTEYPSYTFYKNELQDITPGTLLNINVDNCYSQLNFFEQNCEYITSFDLPNEYFRMYYGQNEADDWVHFAATDPSFGGGISGIISNFALEGSTPDLLFVNTICLDRFFRVWQEGFGETLYRLGTNGCEYYYNRYLEGNIKNGDTTGVITPFDVETAINIPLAQDTQVSIKPNPVAYQLDFNIKTVNTISTLETTIYDTTGKVWKTQQFENTTSGIIHVKELPKGVYFLSFKYENGVYSRKFVKW